MKKPSTSLLLLLGLLFCKPGNTQNQDSAIVLILDSIPTLVRSISPFPKFTMETKKYQLTIFDNFNEHRFNPRPGVLDTIIFLPQSDHTILSFYYEITRQPLDYVVRRGDTLGFRFVNGMPYVTVHDKKKEAALNYEYNKIAKHGFRHTPFELYKEPVTVSKSVNELLSYKSGLENQFYLPARGLLTGELSVLNSWKEFKQEFLHMYEFYHDKLTNQIYSMDRAQAQLTADTIKNILYANKAKPVSLSYSYFLPLLETIADSAILKKATLLRYSNGSELDYREVYDKTNEWADVNDFYKKQLLFKYLQKIGDKFSLSDLEKYLSKFAEFSKDTLLVKNIKSKFLVADNKMALSKDSLYMLDAQNRQLSLQQVLNANKGKVVYIDFWASWCFPCRQQMPHAKELWKQFEDVVFVYLSVDKNKEEWAGAAAAEGLSSRVHNYVVLNAEQSAFLKSIDFGPIPRYLLYDKDGKLVHKNAPGPGSEEIKKVIETYLKK
ncbi:TlpA family protein disulfide reductase [Niabella sp. CJ426]|uniref:TlpA family protein disulfide reductase n=1 Tax=Niabella sp. CJ426 TaxID=3393740 RepID=UPI003D0398A0